MLTRPLTQPLTGPLVRGVGEGGSSAPSLNNYSVSNPLYIAHRGGALMYPEETTEGYAASFAAGNRVLEMDVQILSDGGLGLMHDATVDRTTTGTGNVSSFDTAGWKALAIDANTWFGGNFGNALVPPLFPDIITAYRGRAILVPEAKVTGDGPNVVAALQAGSVPTHQGLVQAFALTDLAAAVSAGYPALFLASTADNLAAAQAAGVTWCGIDQSAADSVFTSWITAGIKTTAWTVNRRYRRDQLLGLGVCGFFSDDPQYLKGNAPVATTDNFAAQTWQTGMIASDDGAAATSRGQFFSPDYWGYASTTTGYVGVLQGWACPLRSPSNFTLDFKLTFVSANAGDTTRWASVWIQPGDYPYKDAGGSTETGYHLLIRKDGSVQIFIRSGGAATALVNVGTGNTIADGAEVAYRITVTPTTLTLARLAANGSVQYSAVATDSTYRGGYFHLGRNGLACKFRDITIA